MTVIEKKRLSALFVIGVFLMVFAFVIMSYYKTTKRYNREITSHQKEIKVLRQKAANKPALQKNLDEVQSIIDQSDLFIDEADEKKAGLRLLSVLNEMIQNGKGKINLSKVATNARNTDKSVRVTASLSINNADFIDLIREISIHRPAMNIVKLRVNPIQRSKNIKDEETKKVKRVTIQTGELRVSMDVESFYIGAPATEEATP